LHHGTTRYQQANGHRARTHASVLSFSLRQAGTDTYKNTDRRHRLADTLHRRHARSRTQRLLRRRRAGGARIPRHAREGGVGGRAGRAAVARGARSSGACLRPRGAEKACGACCRCGGDGPSGAVTAGLTNACGWAAERTHCMERDMCWCVRARVWACEEPSGVWGVPVSASRYPRREKRRAARFGGK
jgi:hypothetical protein